MRVSLKFDVISKFGPLFIHVDTRLPEEEEKYLC